MNKIIKTQHTLGYNSIASELTIQRSQAKEIYKQQQKLLDNETTYPSQHFQSHEKRM